MSSDVRRWKRLTIFSNRLTPSRDKMGNMTTTGLRGVEPYLYYSDGAAALDWLTRVFGFRGSVRYLDQTGAVAEAEVMAGSTRVHVAGGCAAQAPAGIELIVVVDDVDTHRAATAAAGVEVPAPKDRPYAARTYSVRDPQGYRWTFWQPLPGDVQLQPGWREVRT
ncbi:glyoxalase [soil metagenome]